MMMFGYGWFGMMCLMTFWLFLFIAVFWGVGRLLRHEPDASPKQEMSHPFQDWRRTAQEPSGEPSALELLQQRYAHGEMDEVTFEHMRERILASTL
jgi:Predicted membrane protein